jgi:predicted outer membrane repeat protein
VGWSVWLGVLGCTDAPSPSTWVTKTATGDTGEPAGCEGPSGYLDLDGDGFGSESVDPCGDGSAIVQLGGDCDDADPGVFPGAPELCDRLERDCDAQRVAAAQIGALGFPSLEEALAAAAEGDLIEVCDGTIEAHDLQVTRSVTLASLSGQRDLAVIDGQGEGPLFVVTGGTLTLRSLTLREGASEGSGGAVDATSGGLLTVEDCVLEDHTAAESGGALIGRDVTLVGSLLRRNTAQSSGGAAYATGELQVVGCTFEDNAARAGGGALSHQPATFPFRVEGSIFLRNESAAHGGAIYGSGLEIVDSSFTDNVAVGGGYGGAVSLQSGAATVSGSTFDFNLGDYGGALYREFGAGDLHIVDSAFVGNEASYGGGAGYVYGPGALDLQAVSFTGNEAPLYAGALRVFDTDATADAATVFEGNLCTSPNGSGGALQLTGDGGSASWTGGTFLDNQAGYMGGAIYAATLGGGQVALSGLTVEGNTSGYSGGGVYLYGDQITMTDSALVENVTVDAGGGGSANGYGSGEIVWERVELRGNRATGPIGGGGTDVYNTGLRMVDCSVSDNEAVRGGGVLVDEGAWLSVEGTDFGEGNAPDDIFVVGQGRSYEDLGADVTLGCQGGEGCAL